MNEGLSLPIYTNQVTDLLHDWTTYFTNMANFSQRDSKYTLHDVTLGTIDPTYNEGCTSRSIHNNEILKGSKHISDGGTTTYNDDIHQNIFQSYKYINTLS